MKTTWRDLPPTQKQVDALQCTGLGIPATRGEASDLIGGLLESGKLVKFVNGVPVVPNTDITDVSRVFAKIEAEHGNVNL